MHPVDKLQQTLNSLQQWGREAQQNVNQTIASAVTHILHAGAAPEFRTSISEHTISVSSSSSRLPSSVNFASITNANSNGRNGNQGPASSSSSEGNLGELFASLPDKPEELEDSPLFQLMKQEKFRGSEAKKIKDLTNSDGSKPYKDCKTWADFYLRVKEQKKLFDAGLGFDSWDSDQMREWREVSPSWMLRPRAEKLLMRTKEVEKLELDLMGKGAVFTGLPIIGTWPFGGLKDYAYGIFARGDLVTSALGPKWAKRDPDAVVASQAFYDDIVTIRHACEMTLMVHVSREMELAELAKRYKADLKSVARAEAGPSIDKFIDLFDVQRINPHVSWLTADKKVKEGTKLLLTATPSGKLVGEVVSPGRLMDQKVTVLGAAEDPLVSEAVFKLFLGEKPKDEIGKKLVGKGCVFVANGHQFPKSQSARPKDVHTWFGDYKAPEAVEIDATPDAFHLGEGKADKGKMFVHSSSVLKKSRKATASTTEGPAGDNTTMGSGAASI